MISSRWLLSSGGLAAWMKQRGQRTGDEKRPALLCSVTLQVMKGGKRQVTSVVFHCDD